MSSPPAHPLAADLDHVLAATRGLWEELRGRRIFITGGTGFVGTWLLESFAWANRELGLGAKVVVLSRDPAAFARKAPHLARDAAIEMLRGDVRTFAPPPGDFSHAIHAATQSSAMDLPPLEMIDTIVLGTRRVLEFARQRGIRKLLFTSSGAVYGRQPPDVTHIPEDCRGGPDPGNPRHAYGEGKRLAEMLCAIYADLYSLEPKIARAFAFVGPYLPLEAHFAIGNFIRDGLAGGPIRVTGDGSPRRSYLYAADLAIWLWTILFQGSPNRPYNVGSDAAINIRDLAAVVARCFTPAPAVVVVGTPDPARTPEWYVPDTRRAARDLGLHATVDLPAAITRTIAWHRRETQP